MRVIYAAIICALLIAGPLVADDVTPAVWLAIIAPAITRKTYAASMKEMKISDEGKGRIVFATFNTVDKDGDITEPGAFGTQLAHLLPMHIWKDADTPFIGIARISETDREAVADIELNMELQRAKDWRSSLKFALDRGKTIEWSYGFDVVDSEMRTIDGATVRVLKRLVVHEVSPVVIGAGVNTHTQTMKAFAEIPGSWERAQQAIRESARQQLTKDDDDGYVAVEATFSDRVIVAVWTNGERKYYQFSWSMRDDGVVVLTDQREVQLDLVIREKSLKYDDQFARVLGELGSFSDRTKALAALRLKEGRVLSSANRRKISGLAEQARTILAEMEALLAETDPDAGKAAAENLYAQFLRTQSRLAGHLKGE